jgi:carbon storage regulator
VEAVSDWFLSYRKESSMLVLSRKRGEKIDIGDDIAITVVDIFEGLVRLGIEARRGVPIRRREITLAIETGSSVKTPREDNHKAGR